MAEPIEPAALDEASPSARDQVNFLQRKIVGMLGQFQVSPGSGVSKVESGPMDSFPALVFAELDPIGPIEIEIRARQ